MLENEKSRVDEDNNMFREKVDGLSTLLKNIIKSKSPTISKSGHGSIDTPHVEKGIKRVKHLTHTNMSHIKH